MEETNNKKQTTKTGKVLDFELLKRVLEFAKPYKFNFIIAAFSAILLSAPSSSIFWVGSYPAVTSPALLLFSTSAISLAKANFCACVNLDIVKYLIG